MTIPRPRLALHGYPLLLQVPPLVMMHLMLRRQVVGLLSMVA